MSQQKLILVSMDAMIREDLDYLKTKPSFGWLLDHCAQVERVRSIYPTLTYPCHATMVTGCWPAKHGVVNNTYFRPGEVDPDWLWYHDVYQIPDLLDAAKAKGLTTAAIGWPAMGNHPSADWIVGEIAHTRAKTASEYQADYLRTGTTPALWEQAGAPNIFWRTERGNDVSRFNASACCAIIRAHQPDLTILHVGEPDAARHKHGVYGAAVRDKLDVCEEILTWLLEAIRDAGIENCTNLIVTADHGQMDAVQLAQPNILLVEGGFAELNADGSLKSWRAWSHMVGMSATVYVKAPGDEPVVYDLLKAHEGQGYSKVYTREEAAAEGFAGEFAFVLETDGRTEFGNGWLGEYLRPIVGPRGDHGFHPDKGPRPTLLAAGPAFQTGAWLKHADLIDGAPTWAKVLGLDLPNADGRALEELLV